MAVAKPNRRGMTVLTFQRPALGVAWRLGAVFLAPFAVAALAVSLLAPDYLLAVWFGFYTSVSNFFIPWLPLRPMILLFGTLFAPWVIAVIGGAATAWVEYFNYRMLGRVLSVKQIKAATEKRPYQIAERWFKKFPFLIIVLTGFTPVPFAPFRVLVVSARYPIDRYIAAILVGRTPRYYLWALLGAAIDLPLWGYGVICLRLCRRRSGRVWWGSEELRGPKYRMWLHPTTFDVYPSAID